MGHGRFHLLHGPYLPPKTRRGRRLFCEVRGTVEVGGYSDGPVPWPRVKKGGVHSLILCGDLVRAVRHESAQAVAHHFAVSKSTVRKWRRALDVPEHNEGTRRLGGRIAVARDDDRLARARAAAQQSASVELRAAPRRGKPPHPNLLAASAKADHHPPGWREKMSATFRARGNWLQPHTRPWTAADDALLGTARDAEVARRQGRTTRAVYLRRFKLGVPGFLEPVNGKLLRSLRRGAGLTQAAMAARARVGLLTVRDAESGQRKRVARDALERLAAALAVEPRSLAR